ncbi:MAG: TIGR04283 family arsenosugar biosynthesis glycosyltransferase [Gemmataceae bacterium]
MKISVIIPTLNEESCLSHTLESLRVQRPHEIIVVDGGSTDATCKVATALADQVLQGPRGRAIQMNLGAAIASGDALLFLHADCFLEAGALPEMRRCLKRRGVAAGCFRMAVQASGLLYRSIDACASLRVRLTGLVYGDQGLFLKRDVFSALGCFPDVPLMEDVFFSKKLRRYGRILVAKTRVLVSPRRWQQKGIIRQSLRNWSLLARAAWGVSPRRLASAYPEVR